MANFNFVESGHGAGARTDLSKAVLRLNKHRLSIGDDVFRELGRPTRLVLEHDVKALAIRLSLADHSLAGYSVQHRPGSTEKAYIKTNTVQQFIPLGEYLPISNNIFVHESVQR